MPLRPLPSRDETSEILSRKRSRAPARPPPPAGKSLSKFLKEAEERFGKGPRVLSDRWPEIIADPRLAQFTEPIKLVKLRGQAGSVLELKVDGPAAALVQHQAEQILARVNLVTGSQAVTRLRIVQGPVKARSELLRTSARRRRNAGPIDAAAEAELVKSLEAAPDTPLKAALLKLGRAVIRRQDGS